jgi:hypothetical protein
MCYAWLGAASVKAGKLLPTNRHLPSSWAMVYILINIFFYRWASLFLLLLFCWCHQKYFTLQFRPSPSEIVVMTRRTSPLTIQCIIPICMWNIHNLTNPTLCLLTFLNLGQCHVFVLLQSPPGRLGHARPQWYSSSKSNPCRRFYTPLWILTWWFHVQVLKNTYGMV